MGTELTEEQAAIAFATMVNQADVSAIADLLDQDVHFSSPESHNPLRCKKLLLDHLRWKLLTIRRSPGTEVWAELATVEDRPCVALVQGDLVLAVALFRVAWGRIRSIDIRVDFPEPVKRTGIFPGKSPAE